MVHLMDISDNNLLYNLLTAIDNILEIKDEVKGDLLELFDSYKGGKKLENLQLHENKNIYRKINEILEKHYTLEEDEIDSNG